MIELACFGVLLAVFESNLFIDYELKSL